MDINEFQTLWEELRQIKIVSKDPNLLELWIQHIGILSIDSRYQRWNAEQFPFELISSVSNRFVIFSKRGLVMTSRKTNAYFETRSTLDRKGFKFKTINFDDLTQRKELLDKLNKINDFMPFICGNFINVKPNGDLYVGCTQLTEDFVSKLENVPGVINMSYTKEIKIKDLRKVRNIMRISKFMW